jgi:hypothetical protein
MALHAVLAVPVGLAVAHEQELGHRATVTRAAARGAGRT